MKENLEKAIKALAEKASQRDVTAIDAQQYAQAVLNLANALIGLTIKQ